MQTIQATPVQAAGTTTVEETATATWEVMTMMIAKIETITPMMMTLPDNKTMTTNNPINRTPTTTVRTHNKETITAADPVMSHEALMLSSMSTVSLMTSMSQRRKNLKLTWHQLLSLLHDVSTMVTKASIVARLV